MKSILLTFGTIVALIAGTTLFSSCGGGSQQQNATEQQDHDAMDMDHRQGEMAAAYACPMHPEETGKKGDKCSKCGMALEPVKQSGKKMDMAAMASCPMHPEVTGKEGDKCPKCGMALVMAESGQEKQ